MVGAGLGVGLAAVSEGGEVDGVAGATVAASSPRSSPPMPGCESAAVATASRWKRSETAGSAPSPIRTVFTAARRPSRVSTASQT